jgi:hypothetical protein
MSEEARARAGGSLRVYEGEGIVRLSFTLLVRHSECRSASNEEKKELKAGARASPASRALAGGSVEAAVRGGTGPHSDFTTPDELASSSLFRSNPI